MRIYEVKERTTLPHIAHPFLILGKDRPKSKALTGILIPKRHETIVDYMEYPMRLVSTKMKDILCAHESRIKTRAVSLYNPETNDAVRYWDFQPQRQFVLHESLTNTWSIDNPILDRKMVKQYNVFTVVGLATTRCFITLSVLEALYRHEIIGFEVREVELK